MGDEAPLRPASVGLDNVVVGGEADPGGGGGDAVAGAGGGGGGGAGDALKKRCTYAGCERPTESKQFIRISKGSKGGGKDWSALEGELLCRSCYVRYMKRGTLEDGRRPQLSDSEKRCTWQGCAKPDESREFIRITKDTRAGGRDWSTLNGNVLCHACYMRYRNHGTLNDTNKAAHLSEGERRCQYEGCSRPDESREFHIVTKETKGGGQDWSPLHGQVLCDACFARFKRHGRLEGGRKLPAVPLGEDGGGGKGAGAADKKRGRDTRVGGCDRRCSNEGCARPDESARFHLVTKETKGGGQDWSLLEGQVPSRAPGPPPATRACVRDTR